jgi:hypothetical protein
MPAGAVVSIAAIISLAITAGMRIAQGIRTEVQRILRLGIKITDLSLKLVWSGQKGLVQLCGNIDGYAGGLVVPAGLPAEADVDRKGHRKSPCPESGR